MIYFSDGWKNKYRTYRRGYEYGNEKMDKEQQDKCEGIGKHADMEDKKTIKRRSFSESFTKRTLSSKSLFNNLYSRKKVSSLSYY